jgi:hypothetical protein
MDANKNNGPKQTFPYKETGGNSHPKMHSDLGSVCRVADGRVGIVKSIGFTGRVAVGQAFDFGLWENEIFNAEDVTIIGVLL